MEPVNSIATFVRDPIGRWIHAAPTVIVWCSAPDLCGAVAWGRPTLPDVKCMFEAFDGYRHRRMAPRFAVVLDGREIEGVDPDALAVVVSWLGERRLELAERVSVQVGVVADTMSSVTLTGILPIVGETHPFRLVRHPEEALLELSPGGAAIGREVESAVREARGASMELRQLQGLLRQQPVDASIEDSARELAVSVRTLQRVLQAAGTSFRAELREARYAVARELLIHGDGKVSIVASRVGLSERALTELIRGKTGATPAGLRKKTR